ncbi:hypothetical protein [Sulfurimonas sp.]|uniref:hypothetical protein n=1 Tax=Sulfurimonas sp. TaxID=2022749 RepID=UPI0025EF6322|nr:hypothetical protein [Sulfurimonas sp.]
MAKLFEALYHKVFVNIVVQRSQSIVYIEECSKKAVLKSDSETFNTTELSNKMCEYINSFTSESPFHYISILDTSDAQGAIPTCSSKEMSRFNDMTSSKYICHSNEWTYFTSKSNLDIIKYNYADIGVDFIFSPFTVLAHFFKDKIDSTLALYILLEDNYITISVFDNSRLLYGDHIDMEHGDDHDEMLMDESGDDDIDLDLDGSIDLDDVDAMDSMSDIEGLDDFGDIEDLDTLDDIDEFAETEHEEDFSDKYEETSVEDVSGFNEDYQRYSLIQSSINRFYKDHKYESKFVENVYVADAISVSGDLKRYLEEEMFLNVFIRQLDLGAEVCELAKADLK